MLKTEIKPKNVSCSPSLLGVVKKALLFSLIVILWCTVSLACDVWVMGGERRDERLWDVSWDGSAAGRLAVTAYLASHQTTSSAPFPSTPGPGVLADETWWFGNITFTLLEHYNDGELLMDILKHSLFISWTNQKLGLVQENLILMEYDYIKTEQF